MKGDIYFIEEPQKNLKISNILCINLEPYFFKRIVWITKELSSNFNIDPFALLLKLSTKDMFKPMHFIFFASIFTYQGIPIKSSKFYDCVF